MSAHKNRRVLIALVFAGFLLPLTYAADTGTAAGKQKTVRVRDPRTGKITTQIVDAGQQAAEPNETSAPPRLVQIRDPQTGRTVTQEVPVRSLSAADMEKRRQQQAERYQKKLLIPDEQWISVKPLLIEVLKRKEAMIPSVNRSRTTNAKRPQMQPEDTAPADQEQQEAADSAGQLSEAFNALADAAGNAEATDALIAEKMQAYQQKRQELQQDLQVASDQLKTLLTVRQQAQLVLDKVLE